jgi:hypothetical protein
MKKPILLPIILLVISYSIFPEDFRNYGDAYDGIYQMVQNYENGSFSGVYPMKMEIIYIERLDGYIIRYLYDVKRNMIPINDLFISPLKNYVYYSSTDYGNFYIYLDDEEGKHLILVHHDDEIYDQEPYIDTFIKYDLIKNNPYP